MAREELDQQLADLPEGWKVARLGDMISLRGGLSYKGEFLSDLGNSLVTMGCVSTSERFKRSGLKRYRGDFTERHRLRVGDMVIATRDVTQNRELLGSPALVPEGLPGEAVIAATNLYMVANHSESPTEFLYWLMKTPAYRNQIVASAKGTTVVMLTKDSVENFTFPLPPLAEQRAIAAVLGALDDKIELNRRMNATLEAMARALFQSWFVDFDPVRAKLDPATAGPTSNLSPATAALFPDSFQDSELGHIPMGWTTGKLADIATNPRRGVQPSGISPNMPYIALEHMPRRCIALGDWDESADVASGKSAFNKGEILFGKLRPYFHKVGVAPLDGVCSTDILVLAPKSPEWFGFLLGHASSDELIQFTDLASTGTKMPRTNWGDISSFKVALPPKPLAAAFTEQIEPMVERITANLHQSRTLATLRDTLLPKLLSGELSVGALSTGR